MKRILILHGWMHSSERYRHLKKILEMHQYNVTLYEFPGFGETPATHKTNILKNYTIDLINYLNRTEFDCIIAHSMGGNIILKSWSFLKKAPTTLILLSPEYGGILFLRPFIILFPLIFSGMYLLKLKCRLTNFIIKCLSLFTINHWNYIDQIILEDVRRANPWISSILIFEMAYDNWRYRNSPSLFQQIYLFSGEPDRIISKSSAKKLKKDIPNCKQKIIPKIGHTIVLEAFDTLVKEIDLICGED